ATNSAALPSWLSFSSASKWAIGREWRPQAQRPKPRLDRSPPDAKKPDRAAWLLKQLNLQALQPRSFRPQTAQSPHSLGYSPNPLSDALPPSRLNQSGKGVRNLYSLFFRSRGFRLPAFPGR